MSTTTPQRATNDRSRRGSPWATGLAVFAGILMLAIGVNQVLLGIAALVNDEVYLRVPDYLYAFDLTTWGWVHLVIGAVLVATGLAVVAGKAWARGVGIGLVVLNLIANFMFIPYYPVGSVLLVALDVAVIWGLTVYRDDTV
jgi:hypothetical protein